MAIDFSKRVIFNPEPVKVGDIRVRSGFVFWKSINNQTRFLQHATWQEIYQEWCDPMESIAPQGVRWFPLRWL